MFWLETAYSRRFLGSSCGVFPLYDVTRHPGSSTILERKHDVLDIQRKNQCNCWSFFDFPVDFCMGLTIVQRCINALPVIQDGCCLPSWIFYWKSWTTHEGPLMVSTPCKNFVMIDLVAFKLNVFYIFGLFMLDSPIQVPKNSV